MIVFRCNHCLATFAAGAALEHAREGGSEQRAFAPFESIPAIEEHVILVALEVRANSRAEAESVLHARLPIDRGRPQGANEPFIESWWIAEDGRLDGSDNDSAVFVHPGMQERARAMLRLAELCP